MLLLRSGARLVLWPLGTISAFTALPSATSAASATATFAAWLAITAGRLFARRILKFAAFR